VGRRIVHLYRESDAVGGQVTRVVQCEHDVVQAHGRIVRYEEIDAERDGRGTFHGGGELNDHPLP